MKYLRYLVLAIAAFVACAYAPLANAKDAHPDQIMGNRCFAKGGIGIITVDLYVDLKSARNELILKSGQHWSGKDVGVPELVFVFENQVWYQNDLPRNFDLSKSFVVSFEANSVKFAQLDSMSGGYYERPAHT